jgi:hypothetical protein
VAQQSKGPGADNKFAICLWKRAVFFIERKLSLTIMENPAGFHERLEYAFTLRSIN